MEKPIILIDDSAVQIKVISAMLEGAGYKVISYLEPEEAISGIIEHKPALVLCDYIMPAMNGVDFCKKVKSDSIFDDGFFLIITDSVEWGTFISDFHDLPDGWIAKTLSKEDFLAKVAQWYSMVP
jgi:sigma-B regulation protein RsbU (phosphoserine phosphatase)